MPFGKISMKSIVCVISFLFATLSFAGQSNQTHNNAPKELKAFDFLIGSHSCNSSRIDKDGNTQTYKSTWNAEYLLEGFVLTDEYTVLNKTGTAVFLGANYRTYSPKTGWSIRWYDSNNGTWKDVAPKELGGVKVTENNVSFKYYEENQSQREVLFTPHVDGFLWSSTTSNDQGQTWDKGSTIECLNNISS